MGKNSEPFSWFTGLLYRRPVTSIGILFLCGTLLILTNLYFLARQLNENTAAQYGRQYIEFLEKFRDLYTSEVVDRVEDHGVPVTHDYTEHTGAIPYPATFTHILSKEIIQDQAHTWTDLYSDYPWPWRKDGGPRDRFEKEALAAVRRAPGSAFTKIVEKDGIEYLRYASGVVMRQDCVDCHNTHEDSPKRDWRVGDVRGVLEVSLPISSNLKTIRTGMLQTLAVALAGAVAGLFILGLVINRLRDSMGELNRANLTLEETSRSLDRFVPHEFLSLLRKPSIINVHLGDYVTRDMTILFSDIRSFTSISESMSPEETFRFVNEYFAAMAPVIREHNGFIDKYIGDSIMALFRSAEDALDAAIALHDRLAALNSDRRGRGLAPIGMGIGLNSGGLMLGTVGEENRMDGTVISDAVNLASRIEGLTKLYGCGTLMGEATHRLLVNPGRFCIRKVDLVMVKGKSKPVALYELFDNDPEEVRTVKLGSRDILARGLASFAERNMEEARDQFVEGASLSPGDPVFRELARRCEELIRSGCGDDCDIVRRIDSK